MNIDDKKNIIWNTIGSTLAAISSLVFLIIVTRVNGVFDAGIFTYSFSTACLFYTISIYSTRSYQVTDINKKNSDFDYIYNRLTTCIIMLAVSFIFCLIKKYDIYKSTILILLSFFKCLETMEETLYAILQKNGKLENVGKSMSIRSIFDYILFFIIDIITNNIIISIISIVIINILIILLYDINKIKTVNLKITKFSKSQNLNLLKLGFNTFVFSFLSIYLINASRYAIDNNLSDDLQTIYGIIVMPAMVMSLLSQFVIQPFLTRITNYIEFKEIDNLKKIIVKIIGTMLIIGMIVIIVGAVIGIPVLNIIYNLKLNNYKIEFILILIGALFYGISIIISTILIALRKTFSQVISLGLISLGAIFTSRYLVSEFEIFGASFNYFIIMFIEFLVYIILLIGYIRNLSCNINGSENK